MGVLIRAEALTRRFNDLVAVDNLSLEVNEGEVLALLGHNGAGKTTTVRMLTSILKPTSGHAWVAGLDVEKEPIQVRRRVGHLTETPGLYSRMRAGEYLEFFGELYGMPRRVARDKAEQLLERFDLREARDRRLGEFSKGMRQKVALCRAMIHSPRALFLDEPTAGLDPQGSKQVRDAIVQLRKTGHTVLLCTHNLFEAEFLANRIAVVSRGKLRAMGTAEELKTKFLGAPLMEVRLAKPISSAWPELADLITIEAHGPMFLRYRAARPEIANPLLLKRLDELQAEVVTISHAPQSLEQVYLKLIEREAPNDR